MARNHSGVMKDGKPIIADKMSGLGRQIQGQILGPSPDFRYKWLLMDINWANFIYFRYAKSI